MAIAVVPRGPQVPPTLIHPDKDAGVNTWRVDRLPVGVAVFAVSNTAAVLEFDEGCFGCSFRHWCGFLFGCGNYDIEVSCTIFYVVLLGEKSNGGGFEILPVDKRDSTATSAGK